MNTETGKRAEQTAAVFLQKKGLRVLQKNYRCRNGEIDIVAEDGNVLVFVEVRRRRRVEDAAASIDRRKQRRLTAAATHYLSGGGEQPCRFDAVLVDEKNAVHWLRGAFDAAEIG